MGTYSWIMFEMPSVGVLTPEPSTLSWTLLAVSIVGVSSSLILPDYANCDGTGPLPGPGPAWILILDGEDIRTHRHIGEALLQPR